MAAGDLRNPSVPAGVKSAALAQPGRMALPQARSAALTQRLVFLNALAILAVAERHAADWAFYAWQWWQPKPVGTPGDVPYTFLLVARQLPLFAVPAFLFFSGFFVAYAARGTGGGLSWKVVYSRLSALLVPYLVWSTVILAGRLIQSRTYVAGEYIERILAGKAAEPFYYVPLLFQLYMLSPWITRLAGARPRLLLSASALIQIVTLSAPYLPLVGVHLPGQDRAIAFITGYWAFCAGWVFFFCLGAVAGLHVDAFKAWLARLRPVLPAALAVCTALSLAEAHLLYQATGHDTPGPILTVISSLYGLVFILAFLSLEVVFPWPAFWQRLNVRTFGIYLVHYTLMGYLARAIERLAPGLLVWQPLLLVVLVGASVALPWLLMEGVIHTPARRLYRYLFG